MRPYTWVCIYLFRIAINSNLTCIHASLWGNPKHLQQLATALRQAYSDDSLQLLVAERNAGNSTYDGIELGGERVTREVEDEITKLEKGGKKVTKLSMIGYSLGGLVARYAIGLLYSAGLFDKIQPMVSTTTGVPHKLEY